MIGDVILEAVEEAWREAFMEILAEEVRECVENRIGEFIHEVRNHLEERCEDLLIEDFRVRGWKVEWWDDDKYGMTDASRDIFEWIYEWFSPCMYIDLVFGDYSLRVEDEDHITDTSCPNSGIGFRHHYWIEDYRFEFEGIDMVLRVEVRGWEGHVYSKKYWEVEEVRVWWEPICM